MPSRALLLDRAGPWVLLVVFACGCGGSGSPPAAPSPSPAPAAPAPGANAPLNMAGVWNGSLEVPGQPVRTVAMLIVQSVDCVDGAFHTEPAELTGAISGYSSATSFAGSFSLQRPADGQGKCTGSGATEASITGTTLTISVPALSSDCAAGGLPQSMTFTLRRQ